MNETEEKNARNNQPSDRERAYHEAGHMITGYIFYSVNGVTIEEGESLGDSTLGSADVELPDNVYLGGAENEDKFKEYIKIIICLFSGRYCQYIVNGKEDPKGAVRDEELLSYYLFEEDGLLFYSPFTAYAAPMTKFFCSQPVVKAMIDKLAKELETKKKLSKEEVAELLKDFQVDAEQILQAIHDTYFNPFCKAMTILRNGLPPRQKSIIPPPPENA